MYHIVSNARPINDKTFATIEDAIAFATAPAWAGAAATDITMISEVSYKLRGDTYHITAGENPTVARREARAASKKVTRSPRAVRGDFRRSSYWLSVDMDRADSDN